MSPSWVAAWTISVSVGLGMARLLGIFLPSPRVRVASRLIAQTTWRSRSCMGFPVSAPSLPKEDRVYDAVLSGAACDASLADGGEDGRASGDQSPPVVVGVGWVGEDAGDLSISGLTGPGVGDVGFVSG